MSNESMLTELPRQRASPKWRTDSWVGELGVIAVDAHERVTWMNSSAGNLLGVEAGAFLRRPLSELLLPVCAQIDVQRTLETARSALLAGQDSRFELQLLADEPQTTCLSLYVSPMQGCDVPELGAVLIMEDITPYKKVGLTGLADENARRYTEVQERVSRLEKQKDRLERQKEQYWWQSTHDDLTRVFNYRHFQSLLVQEVARAQRYDHPLAVLMIDVDDFKAYNDSYGHLAGDRVLRNVAVIFQGRRRQTDQLARYGGEEFAMILPETNAEGALALAERLRMAVERGTRNNSDFHRPITVSIGVAVSPPDDPQELVKRADERMYRAKVAGKNRVCGLEETSPTV